MTQPLPQILAHSCRTWSACMRPRAAGPLDGLRFAVKDLIDVAGCRTGGGNPAWLRDQSDGAALGAGGEAAAGGGRFADR